MSRALSALQSGVAFLETVQLPATGVSGGSGYLTTFAPAIVLAALCGVKGTKKIRGQLADWLLMQRGEDWSFNYWAKDVGEHAHMPYPDDLDDTFCALTALYLHNPDLVGEAALGRVVHLLVALEQEVGGPYRTWIAPVDAPAEWQDVDVAVNANIAYFLRQTGTVLPSLTALMEQGIATQNLTSPYYPSLYPVAYFVSRAYEGPHAEALAKNLRSLQKNDNWGTPLQTALALLALNRLDMSLPTKANVSYLLAAQEKSGSWPAELLCVDPVYKGQGYPTTDDSRATTTALVLEALSLGASSKPALPAKQAHRAAQQLTADIYAAAQNDSSALAPDLALQTKRWLKRLQDSSHSDEIALLPCIFAESLIAPARPRRQLLVELGLANVYGWLAYTIFDNFLDDEGRPQELPIATLALRRSLLHFRTALDDGAYNDLVARTFDAIDEANTWETVHCRFVVDGRYIVVGKLPSYTQPVRLYGRSLGHSLTPLGVLAAQGVSLDGPQAQAFTNAFMHYLAARQLIDDLHDWEEDVRAGRVSYVVAAILRDMHTSPGRTSLAKLTGAMQRVFWHQTLLTVCAAAEQHTRASRAHIAKSRLLTKSNTFLELLNGLDATLATTRAEQTKAEEFLAAYRKS